MLPQPTATNSTPPTTCATHSSPSIHGASRNLHTAANLPTAMSFSPYLYSGIQCSPVLHSPLQPHSPHYQMPPSFPITSIATNGLCSPGLSEVEIHVIFQCDPRDCKPQIWYVDKMVGHSTAKCASCTRIQMLPGVLRVKVSGLWIPRGRRAAIERNFYLCAHPRCLSRKPPFSNLRVPPSEIHVSVNSFLDENDIAILTERRLPLKFPVQDLF